MKVKLVFGVVISALVIILLMFENIIEEHIKSSMRTSLPLFTNGGAQFGRNEGKPETTCSLRINRTIPSFTWQTVIPGQSYIYSAHVDNRDGRKMIKVFTIVNESIAENFRLYCYVWYKHSLEQTVVETKIEPKIGGKPVDPFFAYIFRCDLEDLTADIFAVSLGRDRCEPVHNIVAVNPLPISSTDTNFTVCLGPLFNYRKIVPLIEFIEIHRILGVEKFAIYDYSISKDVLKHLKFYIKSGIVEVFPWKVPDHVQVEYQGHLGMVNECLYRYMYTTKYIAFVDSDEMIIPRKDYTWSQLITRLEGGLPESKSTIYGFSFQNMFFNKEWPNDEKSPPCMNSSTYKRITSLIKTRREPRIFPHGERSKMMVKPRMVDVMTIHEVRVPYEHSTVYNVSNSVAALHHYRDWWNDEYRNQLVTDRTMFKYCEELTERVSKIIPSV